MNHCGCSGRQALERLLTGNQSFYTGQLNICPTPQEIQSLASGQSPYAAIVSCSDSRVPPELIFGCSLGELFVVRTAGNVLSQMELGSVEYAVAHLHVPLVMVLGHSGCGAVAGALSAEPEPGALGVLLREIAPSVARAKVEAVRPEQIAALAEDYNILHSVELLRADAVLKAAPDSLILGAKYDLCTGRVTILTEPGTGTAK